jgi:hypothetical protein
MLFSVLLIFLVALIIYFVIKSLRKKNNPGTNSDPVPKQCDQCGEKEMCIMGKCVEGIPGTPNTFPPKPQRSSRKITFHNNTDVPINIQIQPGAVDPYVKVNSPVDLKQHIINPKPIQPGEDFNYTIKLIKATRMPFNGSPANPVDYYGSPPYGSGINFVLVPPDGDTANSTLFEINFSFNGDFIDVSTIPPGSCSAHISANYKGSDTGFADHLPYKNVTGGDGKNIFKKYCVGDDCGDGLGWYYCPKVINDKGSDTDPITGKTYSRKAPNIGDPILDKNGKPTSNTYKYGCGASVDYNGKTYTGQACDPNRYEGKICSPPKETNFNSDSTCPNVCFLHPGENSSDPKVRRRLYECSYYQGKNVTGKGKPGFYKSVQVYTTYPKGQKPILGSNTSIKCLYPNDSVFDKDGNLLDPTKYCSDSYLYPFDDGVGTHVNNSTPDYYVVWGNKI